MNWSIKPPGQNPADIITIGLLILLTICLMHGCAPSSQSHAHLPMYTDQIVHCPPRQFSASAESDTACMRPETEWDRELLEHRDPPTQVPEVYGT